MKKLLAFFVAVSFIATYGRSQCTNTSAFASATASATAGTTVSISTCNYQSEYSTVSGIVSGNTYTATYSLGGCITIHSGTFNGPVIAFGNAPLTFTSTYTGTVYISYNLNCTTCGTATSCGTSTIQTVTTSGGGGGTGGCIGGQNNNCSTADPFCSSQSYTYCNTTGVTGAGQYNCLYTTPNPMWMYLNVATSGSISITINQYTTAGTPIDVDFALWGPFSSLSAACAGIAPSTVIPITYPSGNLVDCSYSTAATEVADIPSAVAGQFYMLLITNYNGSAGYISFNQTGGGGLTNCNIVSPTPCSITSVTATPSTCNASNQYSVSGSVAFTNPPTTGTLTVTSSCGGTQTFNAPFTSPLNYSLTGLTANGSACTVTASFSATTCTGTANFTAPAVPVISGANQTICTGSTLNIPLSSTIAGSTFSWSAANSAQVGGETTTATATNLINNTLTNTTGTAQTVTYTATATSNGCTSAPLQIIATVNPQITPTFTQVAAICSGGTFTLPTTSTNGITGTWSPAINNTATTTYTFTPTAGQCAATATMTVTVNAPVIPTFTAISPICSGGTFTLPTTSNNGYTGTWSPAINNTASTTYIFTPTAGQCASQTNMTVTVTPATTPTFTQVAAICSGGTFTLPTTSNNAITGTWSPAINNTATTTYTFTPTAGLCANTATMTVTVNQPTTPTFTQVQPICTGGTFTLPVTSTNSISGTWSPAINNTATTTYTFTPAASACASTATMTVTVNPQTTPTFTQVAPICSGGTFTLPTTSNNGINGIWTPAINTTATTTYTFIPNAGQCATTTTMTVTVSASVTPTFTQVAAICNGGSFTLPTTSNNGITGTWSPAINNTTTTTYTFTPATGSCASTATMTVTVNQPTTPTFTQVPNICSGGAFTLPTTSNNGIAGTWSPAINNTATTTYTFTPTAGLCATTATMTVTVNQPATPTFTQVAAICSGGSFTLPTTSNNGIIGSWLPAINTTATTTYTFTPNAGQCASTATMTVTVNQPTTPTFTQVAAICSGGSFTLPTTSNNGVTGTWSPAINNTATTTYTFTPTTGLCATTATMTVTVNQPTTPTFTQVAAICNGGTFTLPTTSNNAITGSWSPAINNTATTTYTFTPTAGLCATTATMTVTVNQPTTPTFTQVAAICSGGSFTLNTTSDNGITGTWSPAINNTATTTYTFTPTAGLCATTATMTVNVGAPVTPTFTQVAAICSGGTFTLPTTSNNAITGTWSPAINNTATTTYTFTPTAGLCATTTTMTVTVNQPTTPTFTQVAAICSGGTFTLPTTSNNAITGTWSPAINNTATTTYTFTPTAGLCATTATMTVTVNQPTTPTFTQVAAICNGGSFTLNTTSDNGITGTWSPAINNTATTTYTFTPTAGLCATTATMTVTVNQPTTPTFTQVAAICSGGSFTLNTTSDNGITGTWSPAINNTATTTYTFTPTAGLCATTATMTVNVGAPVTPTFTQVAAICSGGTFTLPTTSNNAITGTWSPAINNTATTTYTFTPTAGLCATTATMTVTVNQPTTPTFTQVAAICSGGSFTLNTTSDNGITGTWSPAINNTATTTYTFTPTAGLCATTATMTVTVNQPTTPTFTQVAAICNGGSFTLNTTSDNGITGTWSPAINNTATTTYTFTPTAGLCATTATMTVTVNQPTTPTFTQVAAICSGGSFTLNTTSDNGITGTWSPAINNTATTTYTFTPTAGLCATTATMTVNVGAPVTPTFTQVAAICSGGTFTLPTTSNNAVTGTWSPAINNTATTTYTFTPTTGLCATTTTMTVTVNQPTTPTFTQVAAICSGGTFTLPTTSNNAITGTWSPAINNTATTTYTFTPTAGLCATTATMTVTVNQPTTPTFTQVAAICNGGSFTLNTTSDNGITGTWSPAINNTATTTYTFTPTAGLCATTATMTVTVNQPTTPTFAQVAAICSGGSFTLNTTSDNGITGTWSPAINNTATTTYTFTPTAGLCATTATMTVNVGAPVTPTFTQVAAICSGGTFTLPTTSNNAVTGTWSPAINNTATTTYTFTPTAGACATTTTMSVTVNPNVTPTFTQVAAICSGGSFTLNTTSDNGITGTWSPAINNTATTTYTFTPTAGLCATTTTMTVTVNQPTTPTFAQVAAICNGGSFTLNTTSDNGITGTWSPAINNTATTTYTFTPTAGLCATTATMTVTVNQPTTPTFAQVAAICNGGSFTLNTTSDNGITGTWSPAINNTATTTYTFTPTAGLCATTATMTVNVGAPVTPTFTQVAAICSGGTFTLPTTSNNAVTGTWSPAINNTATTTYTFTPTAGACATTTTMSVTVNPNVTPTFTQVAAICSGGSFTLNTTSDNGITGTWSPAINNTATTTYTFTPTAGLCATTTTMTVTVNQPTTPTFAQVAAICNGGSFTLNTTSDNGITGTWSPAINNTATTTYTFTPTAGLCATTATMTVTVNQPTTPTFTQIAAICSGGTFTLPTTSNNGVTGTWSPAINNTATTTYTFTPTAGLCATTATMTVNVGAPVTPTFTQVAAICSGGTFTLPTTSNNAVTGTWSPAINNTATTTYTFTPTAGACATTTTMSVTVNPNVTPTFTQVAAICSGGSFTLNTTSDNGITGTWSPAINNTATTTYTFTPTAGLCATTTTMTVTVNQPTTPTFAQVAAICNGGSFTLNTTSDNGITGTWSPAINNTATTTYTFTPTAGLCATTATMTVTVNQPVTPTFPSYGPFCQNDVLAQVMLPTTSNNGINGTWNPGMLSTAAAGTFNYTFTPAAGECALPYSMSVTVNNPVVPTFTQIAPLCSGANFTIPNNSTNAISGTWSPAINNTATTTYTFTPNAGICATTASMTVEIGAEILPTFTPDITTGCAPLTVTFTNTSANPINCSWNFGNGSSINNCGPVTATYTSAGCYDVTLTMTDANGCSGTLTMQNLICVEDAPDVSFAPSTGVISQLNTTVQFNNMTTGATDYDWNFGDGTGSIEFEPTHTFPEDPNGYTVTLVATSAFGCIDSSTVVIQYYEELIYYIPNTFTPDDDMYNQTFKPVFTSGFDPYDYNMYIYNRWGELVFESHDAKIGWDGTYGATLGEKVQDGTYIWKIEFKTLRSDERKQITGHVNIIR